MVAVSPVVPFTSKACTPPSIILWTCFLNPSKSMSPLSNIGNTSATALPSKIVIFIYPPRYEIFLLIIELLDLNSFYQ